MSLEPGTTLGSYEVEASIGAGGMGEVYRARDTKLGRDVAVKVLPESFARDPDRLSRFEREARAVAVLSHPNILAIYDFGTTDGHTFAVTELLEGETLRERLSYGPLPARKAIEYGAQVARGLAAAHEKDVVHRDLKPENLFITTDGRAKILDFGLAKMVSPQAERDESQSSAPTRAAGTEPGVVLGTVGYMSPEQVRGERADHRSDIFAFGAILYEMLSGLRAFQRETGAETMTAILKDDTAELRDSPPALERIVHRCLEKNPGERFQSAYDLAFALESVSRESGPAKVEAAPRETSRSWTAVTLAIVAVLAAYWLGRASSGASDEPLVTYERLTFRRGRVYTAQFDPESRDVIYTASWDGAVPEVYSTLPGTRASRELGLKGADVLSVSSRGEMAVLRKADGAGLVTWDDVDGTAGTLALTTASSGAARDISESVLFADWTADGDELVVVRRIDGRFRVELPIGTVIYETTNVLSSPRVSPDGNAIAFGEKAMGFSSSWSLGFLTFDGEATRFDTGFRGDRMDLAWSPDGGEVWFNMAQGATPDLHAISRNGSRRTLLRPPIPLRILDVESDGRLLVARTNSRVGVMGIAPGDTVLRDFSWLDSTEIDAISGDGKTLLLTEYGEGGGEEWAVYLRNADRSPAVRLGDGQAFDLSPDGKWALTMPRDPVSLVLLPTGPGTPTVVDNDSIVDFVTASFVSDVDEIVFAGIEEGEPLRWFRQSVPNGKPQAITGPVSFFKGGAILGSSPVSPDGTTIAAAHDGKIALYPLDGGEPRVLDVPDSALVIRFTTDGRHLFYAEEGDRSMSVYRIEIETGQRQLWKTIEPDPSGLDDIYAIQISDDGESFYYTFQRGYSDLFLVQGLR
ncbi:MAG TPA: serine/threonine-protein kinase [Vicinamibacteria bacterium]|nr:serine/threonine-protein kinase [Vicinamibacteria bacterium]